MAKKEVCMVYLPYYLDPVVMPEIQGVSSSCLILPRMHVTELYIYIIIGFNRSFLKI